MFIVFLKFSDNKSRAGELMEGHNQWLAQGFDDGVFLVSGTLQPKQGGAILAHNCSMEALKERVNRDPFVAEKVVSAEVLEVTPSKASEEMAFLLN
ncbi:YciI family protein [Marinimicrobium agarilyticum]|uniref:YciI family protein n=1 Tax=Marinimicrobium agarilyticum TaxID=306546 RepID=UPI00041FBB36|nr:YciI family protein [Marinimicrobium agarilyticum]